LTRVRTRLAVAVSLLLLGSPAAQAQVAAGAEQVDVAVIQRIRDEGFQRSQVEQLARHLTDVIGPRLTGSPAMRQANDWTADRFREWQLQGVTVEPWGTFGRGWERVSFYGRMTQPFVQPLNGQPLAWTGSTQGRQEGPVVAIDAVTPDELRTRYTGRLRGAWVMPNEHTPHEPEYDHFPRRIPDEVLLSPPAAQQRPQQQQGQQPRGARTVDAGPTLLLVLDSMMRAEGALGMLRPSPWAYGVLRGSGGGSRNADEPEALPQVMLSHDHYGTLWRNAVAGIESRVELDVQNRFHYDDLQAYNTIADLPGSDLAHEFVIIGAHLDSWHMGTGATDNAAGSVVMMEAIRILRALGLQPRRTIRVALWSGEEQGLLGARNWVANNRELHPRISAYLNIDNGTGRVRGIWDQSNAAAAPIFEAVLAPLRDLGVLAVRHGNTGGTDHLAFDNAGVPGFNFIQDPIEYFNRTHHSNADTFDRLVLDDLRQAAVVVAVTAYHLAMRDELVPRKPTAASTP
jgi:carboxypeptidase Q